MGLKHIFSFGTDPWDPSNRFQTSWLMGPWLLFAFRLLIVSRVIISKLLFPSMYTAQN